MSPTAPIMQRPQNSFVASVMEVKKEEIGRAAPGRKKQGLFQHGLGTHLGEEHHTFLQPPDQRFLVLSFLLLIQELALNTQDFFL